MADWLIHFMVQIGGSAALLAVAGFAVGKWLWGKIDKALESYTSAYAQEAARIDARIGHLEKLAEEQARLTRTVESIKDEIGAQRKMHDNRWEFRKETYVKLLTQCVNMRGGYSSKLTLQPAINRKAPAYMEAVELLQKSTEAFGAHQREFLYCAAIAPLTLDDDITAALFDASLTLQKDYDLEGPAFEAAMKERIDCLNSLIERLQDSGRRNLWSESESGVKSGKT